LKDINQAPKEFRETLLALKKSGFLDDPNVKKTLLEAVKEVMTEARAKKDREDGRWN
jgi:hypothetical protein